MSTLYRNFLSGVVDDNPLLIGATTLNSTALASMPAVTAPDTMWLVLDPEGSAGTPEIVQVTAHTALATSATIVRGQQTSTGGGAARQHAQNTVWVIAATTDDIAVAAPASATVAASQSTSTPAPSDLATVGPVVTVRTGTLVRVSLSATVTASGAGHRANMMVAVSGATTDGAPAGLNYMTGGNPFLTVENVTALPCWTSFLVVVNAGVNTFTAKYEPDGVISSVTFANRMLVVERLN